MILYSKWGKLLEIYLDIEIAQECKKHKTRSEMIKLAVLGSTLQILANSFNTKTIIIHYNLTKLLFIWYEMLLYLMIWSFCDSNHSLFHPAGILFRGLFAYLKLFVGTPLLENYDSQYIIKFCN